mgnify:CR=1 FL=1
MIAITRKTVVGAAIAAVLGTAALAGASQARVAQINPKIALKLFCASGFSKGPGTNSYVCRKNFYVACKKGMSASKPIVTHLGGNKFRIAYSCYYPPK